MGIDVNYNVLGIYAKQMREIAENLNTQLSNAYKKVEMMHNVWRGERYNDLVKKFNDIGEDINQILILVESEIPFTLATIANNYSQADENVNTTLAEKVTPTYVKTIASRKEALGIKEAEVRNYQKEISTCLINAKDQMNEIAYINTKIGKIWNGEAADIYQEAFKSLKNKVISALGDINTSFNSLMTSAINDFNRAENANKA